MGLDSSSSIPDNNIESLNRQIADLRARLRTTAQQLYDPALAEQDMAYPDALQQLAGVERSLRAELRHTYALYLQAAAPLWLTRLSKSERDALAHLAAFYLPFDAGDVAALLATSPDEAEQVCDTLFGYGLLSQDEFSGEYEITANIWQYTQGLLADDGWHNTHNRLADYYLHLPQLDLFAPPARLEALLHNAIINGFAAEAAPLSS
jgi:hypothetical protein